MVVITLLLILIAAFLWDLLHVVRSICSSRSGAGFTLVGSMISIVSVLAVPFDVPVCLRAMLAPSAALLSMIGIQYDPRPRLPPRPMDCCYSRR